MRVWYLVNTIRRVGIRRFVYRIFRFRFNWFGPKKSSLSGNLKEYSINGEIPFFYAQEMSGLEKRFLESAPIPHSISKIKKELTRLQAFECHYLDWLNSSAEADKTKLLRQWIKNSAFDRDIAFGPYPSSIRAINIAIWLIRGGAAESQLKSDVDISNILMSCGIVVDKQIEVELGANHLLSNYMCLTVVGALCGCKRADHWQRKGLNGLRKEIQEQFFFHGGHFERSPMYFGKLLRDILSCLIVLRGVYDDQQRLEDAELKTDVERFSEDLQTTLANNIEWYSELFHPDNDIVCFNDTNREGAVSPILLRELYAIAYGNQPVGRWSIPNKSFFRVLDNKQSKVCIVTLPDGTYLCVDYGDYSDVYQGGHSHCGVGVFELSIRGYKILSNTGCSCYEASAYRAYERSSRAHNTVRPASHETSEVWDVFRLGQGSRLLKRDVVTTESQFSIDMSYLLPSRVIVRRIINLQYNKVEIIDKIENQDVLSTFLLEPNCSIDGEILKTPRFNLTWESDNSVKISQGYLAESFNSRIDREVLELKSLNENKIAIRF